MGHLSIEDLECYADLIFRLELDVRDRVHEKCSREKAYSELMCVYRKHKKFLARIQAHLSQCSECLKIVCARLQKLSLGRVKLVERGIIKEIF